MDRWKATEFRQFLLYTGMVALKGILSAEMCTHFLSFSLGVSMLLSSIDEERNCGISWARELLSYLVTEAAEFYGITFNVYNIHSVIHIADGVENRNCTLDDLSCFRFENFLHCLKRKVKNANDPIAQISKRNDEFEFINSADINKSWKSKLMLSIEEKDKYFYLKDGNVGAVKEITLGLLYPIF